MAKENSRYNNIVGSFANLSYASILEATKNTLAGVKYDAKALESSFLNNTIIKMGIQDNQNTALFSTQEENQNIVDKTRDFLIKVDYNLLWKEGVKSTYEIRNFKKTTKKPKNLTSLNPKDRKAVLQKEITKDIFVDFSMLKQSEDLSIKSGAIDTAIFGLYAYSVDSISDAIKKKSNNEYTNNIFAKCKEQIVNTIGLVSTLEFARFVTTPTVYRKIEQALSFQIINSLNVINNYAKKIGANETSVKNIIQGIALESNQIITSTYKKMNLSKKELLSVYKFQGIQIPSNEDMPLEDLLFNKNQTNSKNPRKMTAKEKVIWLGENANDEQVDKSNKNETTDAKAEESKDEDTSSQKPIKVFNNKFLTALGKDPAYAKWKQNYGNSFGSSSFNMPSSKKQQATEIEKEAEKLVKNGIETNSIDEINQTKDVLNGISNQLKDILYTLDKRALQFKNSCDTSEKSNLKLLEYEQLIETIDKTIKNIDINDERVSQKLEQLLKDKQKVENTIEQQINAESKNVSNEVFDSRFDRLLQSIKKTANAGFINYMNSEKFLNVDKITIKKEIEQIDNRNMYDNELYRCIREKVLQAKNFVNEEKDSDSLQP